MISAATGAVVSTIMLNEDVLLSFRQEELFDFHNLPFYILLGILAGFTSVFHARNFQRVEAYFSRFRDGAYRRAMLGASILALMIFLMPTLFGEGYESIKTLANGNPQILLENTLLEQFRKNDFVLLAFLGVTMLVKSIA